MSLVQKIVVETTNPLGEPSLTVSFLFNGDMSGDVTIEVETDSDGTYERKELVVPASALLEFVGSRMREMAIVALEGAPWQEFTGGLTG